MGHGTSVSGGGGGGARNWGEMLLVPEQYLNGEDGGILQALPLYIKTIPQADDTIVVTDGTTTETWTFKAARVGAFEVTIGLTQAACMANLVTAINLDSTQWKAVVTTSLDRYFDGLPETQMLIIREDAVDNGTLDRVYGSLTVADAIKIFVCATDSYERQSGTEYDLADADPSIKQFGFSRVVTDLIQGETHFTLSNNSAYTWGDDAQIWMITASTTIPVYVELAVAGTTYSMPTEPYLYESYIIKNNAAGDAYVYGNGKDIESNSSWTLYAGDAVTLLYNGVRWLITGRGDNMVDTETWVAVPATSTSTGKQGQRAFDGVHLYECVATNTWVAHPVITVFP